MIHFLEHAAQTKRVLEFADLHERGCLIPETFVIGPHTDIKSVLGSKVMNSSDVAVSLYAAEDQQQLKWSVTTTPASLQKDIENLRQLADQKGIGHYDIVAQEIIDFSFGGVVIALESLTIVEWVVGAPRALLEGGYLQGRLLADSQRQVLHVQSYRQPHCFRRRGGEWIRSHAAEGIPEAPAVDGLLSSIQPGVRALYEFGIAIGQPHLLQVTRLPSWSYPSLDTVSPPVSQGLTWACQRTTMNGASPEAVELPRPDLQLINPRELKGRCGTTTLIFRAGALGAHVVLYSIEGRIPCAFRDQTIFGGFDDTAAKQTKRDS